MTGLHRHQYMQARHSPIGCELDPHENNHRNQSECAAEAHPGKLVGVEGVLVGLLGNAVAEFKGAGV